MSFDNKTSTQDQARSLRTSTSEQHSRQIFYGWWVVLASAIGLFWGVPITVYSFSVFFKPLMQEFHAGRAAVSLAFTLKLFAAALCAAPIGWLTNRYGARRVILTSTGFFGSILLASRLFSGSIAQFYCFYVLLGFCVGGVGPIPYGFLVSHWFDRLRGLALGLTMLGIGLGAVIMPSLAQALIARFGWKTAYSILGASALLICSPVVACLVKESPEDLGLLADGTSVKTDTIADVGRGLTAREAWRTRDFWLMALAFGLVSTSVQGCVVHMAPMLSDRNLGTRAAGLGSSLMGGAVMIGRIGTGYLLDRTFAARLASILFAVAASGIALLWLGNRTAAFGGAFLVGLGLGAEVDLIPYLASRYFGLREFGKVYSILFAAFALAGALGPLIMGAGYDRTGSYTAPLVGFFLASLFATVLMTRLGPYRFRPPEPNIVLATSTTITHKNSESKRRMNVTRYQ
jgi:MFS family permease